METPSAEMCPQSHTDVASSMLGIAFIGMKEARMGDCGSMCQGSRKQLAHTHTHTPHPRHSPLHEAGKVKF